jgi:maleate isomerase
MMSVAYAPDGLLGVLTPQANTTVEPELALLMPRGTAWINGRLMSGRATIADRLRDYFGNYAAAMEQFANAPVGAVAFACTGASYLAGVAKEDATIAEIEGRHGIPVLTAATAVADALRALGARRIGLVSPYDEALDAASVDYWTARGFTVAAKSNAWHRSDAFHPIYSLPGGASQAALDRLAGEPLDAVVMLGTGMPTLHTIARSPRLGSAPVLSCMLCLAWRSVVALAGGTPDAASLLAMADGGGWRDRLPTPAA